MDKYLKTLKRVKNFSVEREWDKFHTPKNVAISVSLEANELLELFQWENDESVEKKLKEDPEYLQDMKDEIADVANYLMVLCDRIGVDLLDIVNEKLEKNIEKYPVEKCKGKADKYTAYQEMKIEYKK